MEFLNWFFKQLPSYFRVSDSYKNSSGEGLLQRYLRVFGQELDQVIIPKIENFVVEYNPLVCDSKYLNHIAYSLGFPPDLFPGDEARYRRFLSIIIKIYQIKGTLKSYEVLFGYLGYSVEIIIPEVEGWRYDENHEYDEEEPGIYDGFCNPCRDYYIALGPISEGYTPLCLPLPNPNLIFTWDLNNPYSVPTFEDPDAINQFNPEQFNPAQFL